MLSAATISFSNQTNVKGGIVHNAWQIGVSKKWA